MSGCTAPETSLGSRLEEGTVETLREIRRERVSEIQRAAGQRIGHQRCPGLQVGAGKDDRIGTCRTDQSEIELAVAEVDAAVGGGKIKRIGPS